MPLTLLTKRQKIFIITLAKIEDRRNEMKRKIVADSSCDLTKQGGADIAFAPLKIFTSEREFIDNAEINIEEMLTYLENYKDKSKTACPNQAEYTAAFEGADEVFCVTITSNLSGSFNAARIAAEEYQKETGARAHVIDTLSVGPESVLIIEKLRELEALGEDFDSTKEKITEYNKNTRLIFSLESMKNLANNGRISQLTAKMAGILGIRAIGRASDDGVLDMTDKVRGEANTLVTIAKNMASEGYSGGKVRIHHVKNPAAAEKLSQILKKSYPDADIKIQETGALCAFYAERGGLLVGFEI